MFTNTLFIIGNGFDLAHGFKTRFLDFKNWLNKTNQNFLTDLTKYLDSYFVQINSSISEPKENILWNYFESALDHINIEEYIDANMNRTSEMSEISSLEKIENCLSFNISYYLQKWLDTIYPLQSEKRSQLIMQSSTARYLSFNYTSTLEDLYKIPDANIFHIHGTIKNSNQKLLCGHDNNEIIDSISAKSQDYDKYTSMCERDCNQIEMEYFKNTLKNTAAIIEEELAYFSSLEKISTINIIGHSLNDIDKPYFRKINEIAKKSIWNIHVYDNHAKESADDLLYELNISSERKHIITKDSPEYFMPFET